MPAAPTNLEAWVARDRELEIKASRSALALMEHRWRAVNEGGFTLAAYARALGRNPNGIRNYVRGWELWQERESGRHGAMATPADALELANMSTERAEAVEIVAKARGVPVSTIRRRVGYITEVDEVRAEITRGVDRAVERGDDPAAAREEAKRHAGRMVEVRQRATDSTAKRAEQNAGRAGFFAWSGIQKELGKARRAMRDAVQLMRESGITDEEFLETLAGASAEIRELTALFDLAVAERRGEQIDWDSAASELLD